MKFRKKPIVIEAFRPVYDEWPEWGEKAYREGVLRVNDAGTGHIIRTLEGDMHASPGDYIVRGIRGELYPCKPDIFLDTYEEVGE